MELLGKGTLGFTKDDVRLHSIRSGGAMAMFLSGVSTIIIQRVSRWESDAFMEYIREQVESFTLGVSEKMVQNESFYHITTRCTDELTRGRMEKTQACMGNGVPNITPHLAKLSYNSLLP